MMRSLVFGCVLVSLFACTSAPQAAPPVVTPLFVGDALLEIPNPKGFCVQKSRETSDGRTSVVLLADCRLQDSTNPAIPDVRGLITISATQTGAQKLPPSSIITAFEIANPSTDITSQSQEGDVLFLTSTRDAVGSLSNQSTHSLFQIGQSFVAISLTGFSGERLRERRAVGFLRVLTRAIISANTPS